MNKIETAVVLKALNEDWALVDYSPDIDFLVFVSESREELDFYPKKELVKEIERLGLIKDLNEKASDGYESDVHYEGDPIKGEWKEITTLSAIVYEYQVTPNGKKFLDETSKIFGKKIPSLKVADEDLDIEPKILKEIVYDKQAIQKLVDRFVERARNQVETAFLQKSNLDLSQFSNRGLLCGEKLWQRLESKLRQEGTRVESRLIQRTFKSNGEVIITEIKDRPISYYEVNNFWKTLHLIFPINEKAKIQRADGYDAEKYLNEFQIQDNQLPSPNLSNFSVVFIVESETDKFAVVVKSDLHTETMKFEPMISGIELIEKAND